MYDGRRVGNMFAPSLFKVRPITPRIYDVVWSVVKKALESFEKKKEVDDDSVQIYGKTLSFLFLPYHD
jgi:hypothetical protein